MTTYRLPEALGGGEVRIVTSPSTNPDNGFVRVLIESVEESFPIDLPHSALVEVKPPLPPEPAIGDCVSVGEYNSVPASVVFRRYEDGWTEPGRDADAPGFEYLTWADVCQRGLPVTLAPDPLAEPVVLPWRAEMHQGDELVVHRYDASSVSVSISGRATGWLGLHAAEDVARALWAAANAPVPEATS